MTGCLCWKAAACLALALCQAAVLVAGSKECEKLGFTGTQSCSDCDSMAEYVRDTELVADCKKCCVKTEEDIKYTSATLEVCPFRLNGLPNIKDFIDKHSQQYGKALKISQTMGAYPKIVLKHKKTGATKSVRIDQWKVATIHEFLQGRLELGKGKKKAATATS